MPVQVIGGPLLIRNLMRLEGDMRGKGALEAGKKAALVIKRAIMDKAPDKPPKLGETTDLKSGWKVTELSKPGDPQITFAITNTSRAWYAHIVERGSFKQKKYPIPKWSREAIAAGRGVDISDPSIRGRKLGHLRRLQRYAKALYGYSEKAGRAVFFGKRGAPYGTTIGGPITPHPFVRPAFEESWRSALFEAGKWLGKRIESGKYKQAA